MNGLILSKYKFFLGGFSLLLNLAGGLSAFADQTNTPSFVTEDKLNQIRNDNPQAFCVDNSFNDLFKKKSFTPQQKIAFILLNSHKDIPGCNQFYLKSESKVINQGSLEDNIYQSNECSFNYKGNLSATSSGDGSTCLNIKTSSKEQGKSIQIKTRDLVKDQNKLLSCAFIEGVEIGRLGGDFFGSMNRPNEAEKCIGKLDKSQFLGNKSNPFNQANFEKIRKSNPNFFCVDKKTVSALEKFRQKNFSTEQKIAYVLFNNIDSVPGCNEVILNNETTMVNQSSISDKIYQSQECLFHYKGHLSLDYRTDGSLCVQVKTGVVDYEKSILFKSRDLIINQKILTCAIVDGVEVGRNGGNFYTSLNRANDAEKCMADWDRVHVPHQGASAASNHSAENHQTVKAKLTD